MENKWQTNQAEEHKTKELGVGSNWGRTLAGKMFAGYQDFPSVCRGSSVYILGLGHL